MKYQSIAKCPPKLEKLIGMVNFVPGKLFFPDVETVMNNVYLEQTGRKMPFFDTENDYSGGKYWTDDDRTQHEKTFNKTLEIIEAATVTFPKLHNYLFEKPEKMSVADWYINQTYIQNPLDAYIEYFEFRRQLRAIASKCTAFANKRYGNEKKSIAFPSYEMDLSSYAQFRIVENKIDFVPSKIIELLQDVDARRLKICPICDEVFWAKRIEAKTCSKRRCKNNFHQRNRRIKEYESRLHKPLEELEAHRAKLEKLRACAMPVPGLIVNQEKLIDEQTKKINKILGKINVEKMKNVAI